MIHLNQFQTLFHANTLNFFPHHLFREKKKANPISKQVSLVSLANSGKSRFDILKSTFRPFWFLAQQSKKHIYAYFIILTYNRT